MIWKKCSIGVVGMLASGGDCQALNATMRGVVKSLYNLFDDMEVIGSKDGYKGLTCANYQIMRSSDFSGILIRGGTILGTSHQPFKQMCIPDENGLDKVEPMKHTYKKLKLDCLVVLGDNGSQKTANLLSQEGLNVISPSKTISSDLWGTDMAFGFQSTVDAATSAIDCIHTIATSHGRVFIVEVMGHKVGWLTLYAGLAGGTGIILLLEIPYDISTVCDVLMKRSKAGKRFSILAVAEGTVSREDSATTRKELEGKKRDGMAYPSVAYEIGARIREAADSEMRMTVSRHMQRDGEPCSYDRVLVTRLGTTAARLIAYKEYSYMVAVKNNETAKVPLSEVAGKLKTVDPGCSMIREAKMMEISFGDE